MAIDKLRRDRGLRRPWWFLPAVAGIVLGALIGLLAAESLPYVPAGARPSVVVSSTPIVVGGATVTFTGSPPADCPPPKVAEAVRAFLDAFNRGDQQALEQTFQRSVIFSSRNPPPVGFFLSSGQRSLLNYFAERHDHGETVELTALHIQYREASSEAGHAPTMNRRADDIPAEVIMAKGAIDCTDRAIILWNQGGP